MFQLMSVPPKIASDSSLPQLSISPESASIQFDNVSFEYIHGQRILDNLSFSVPAGARYAIVGGSGSGKSTIIRLLYRYDTPLEDNKQDSNALSHETGSINPPVATSV